MGIFRKNKGIKKMDAVVTGLILGGIVASVYGIKKHEDTKQQELIDEKGEKIEKKIGKKSIIKALIFGFKEEKPKKPSFLKRIFSLFR